MTENSIPPLPMRGRRTGLPTARKRAGLPLRGRVKPSQSPNNAETALGLNASQPPNQNCADDNDIQNRQLHSFGFALPIGSEFVAVNERPSRARNDCPLVI